MGEAGLPVKLQVLSTQPLANETITQQAEAMMALEAAEQAAKDLATAGVACSIVLPLLILLAVFKGRAALRKLQGWLAQRRAARSASTPFAHQRMNPFEDTPRGSMDGSRGPHSSIRGFAHAHGLLFRSGSHSRNSGSGQMGQLNPMSGSGLEGRQQVADSASEVAELYGPAPHMQLTIVTGTGTETLELQVCKKANGNLDLLGTGAFGLVYR